MFCFSFRHWKLFELYQNFNRNNCSIFIKLLALCNWAGYRNMVNLFKEIKTLSSNKINKKELSQDQNMNALFSVYIILLYTVDFTVTNKYMRLMRILISSGSWLASWPFIACQQTAVYLSFITSAPGSAAHYVEPTS